MPSTFVSVQEKPDVLPDHYLLYKGKAVAEINADNPLILNDGSVNMASLESLKGGDFNEQEGAWYFSKEPETAERYRAWAAERCWWSQTWLIQIQVPRSFVDSLRKEQLWYGHDWKEYVFYCRRGLNAGPMPAKFDKLWKPGGAQIIEGHVCGKSPNSVPRINRHDVQERLGEDTLLKIGDGRKATQTVFMVKEDVSRMGELFRGKIHIDLHSPVISEM